MAQDPRAEPSLGHGGSNAGGRNHGQRFLCPVPLCGSLYRSDPPDSVAGSPLTGHYLLENTFSFSGQIAPQLRAESSWGSRTELPSAAALGCSSGDPTCRDAFCSPLESLALSVIGPGLLLYPALSWGSHELPHLCPAGSRKHWLRVPWLLGARAVPSWVVLLTRATAGNACADLQDISFPSVS